MTTRLMGDGELTRLEVLRDLDRRRLTTEAAAQLLGLGRRQVFRPVKAYRITGAAGLISKRVAVRATGTYLFANPAGTLAALKGVSFMGARPSQAAQEVKAG